MHVIQGRGSVFCGTVAYVIYSGFVDNVILNIMATIGDTRNANRPIQSDSQGNSVDLTTWHIYTLWTEKKRGSTFDIITLEKHTQFL